MRNGSVALDPAGEKVNSAFIGLRYFRENVYACTCLHGTRPPAR